MGHSNEWNLSLGVRVLTEQWCLFRQLRYHFELYRNGSGADAFCRAIYVRLQIVLRKVLKGFT